MAASSRQHRGAKRRKEVARQARQKEKRERKTERKPGEPGGGPPIDWGEAEAVPAPPDGLESEPPASDPQDPQPS